MIASPNSEPVSYTHLVRVKAVFLAELGHQRPGPADGTLGNGGEEVQEQRAVDGVLLHLAEMCIRDRSQGMSEVLSTLMAS